MRPHEDGNYSEDELYGPMDAARVLAWLGFWRDHMPPEAVEQLQRILAPAPAPEGE